ncbi:hypothetical protein [uncultured Aquimarina sp.]|uniref:hypothetical protein n=1 Tax=uncultured Aquimarina sp. TaxID=575652 RepID=UPI00261C4980|nr:hypothetical protein [uncultured Aquimarina sp.]
MGERAFQYKSDNKQTTVGSENIPLQQQRVNSMVVQRLTGYEIEGNIPIYSDNIGINDQLTEKGKNGYNDTIGGFLTVGLDYGITYGMHNKGRYKIDADHTNIYIFHSRLIRKLIALGLLKTEFKYLPMTTIEYITPPRDELNKSSIAEHLADIAAVQRHLKTTVKNARSGERKPVLPPAKGLFTGIPRQDIFAWLEANDISNEIIMPELDAIDRLTTEELNVQQTSGVLPEDIPDIFLRDHGQLGRSDLQLPKLISGVLENAPKVATAAWQDVETPIAFRQHEKAIVGYLTLLASYLLSDHISTIDKISKGTTDKNLVPYLSKTKLGDALGALPAEVRPSQGRAVQVIWELLMEELVKQTGKFTGAWWVETYQLGDILVDDKKSLVIKGLNGVTDIGERHRIWLRKLVHGQKAFSVGTGKPLTLDTPNSQLLKKTGQLGIPLEDRFLDQKTPATVENVADVLGDEFKQQVNQNLWHFRGNRNHYRKQRELTDEPIAPHYNVWASYWPFISAELRRMLKKLKGRARNTKDTNALKHLERLERRLGEVETDKSGRGAVQNAIFGRYSEMIKISLAEKTEATSPLNDWDNFKKDTNALWIRIITVHKDFIRANQELKERVRILDLKVKVVNRTINEAITSENGGMLSAAFGKFFEHIATLLNDIEATKQIK